MKNKTGLIVAMEEEALPFIKGLGLSETKEDIPPFTVYGNDNILLIISGVGELNAALASQYAILKYGCSSLYSTGCCGATGSLFKVGDIVSVERVFKRDVDLTCFGYEKYQLPGVDTFLLLETDPLYKRADCYSSDEFVTANTKDMPSDAVVEMEAYSVAYTAKKYNVSCRVYKVVSDICDNNTDHCEFEKNLGAVSSLLAEHIINLLKNS